MEGTVRGAFRGVFADGALTRGVASEQVAVGETEGEMDFVEFEGTGEEKMASGLAQRVEARRKEWPGLMPAGRKTRKVAVKQLAALLEKHRLLEVDYCSIDVGGAAAGGGGGEEGGGIQCVGGIGC